MTSRLVLASERSTVSMSSGAIVRRSMTSTLMPSAASCSAAARQSCTIREYDTSVTSVPSRRIGGLAERDQVRRGSGRGPLRPYSSRFSMKTTGLGSRIAARSRP